MLPHAFSQTPGTGAIAGLVTDTTHRVLSGAEVIVIDESTHAKRSVVTTSNGEFRISLLPSGVYDVTTHQAGFQDHAVHAVLVTVSQTASLNIELGVAGDKQTVQVQSQEFLTDTEGSTLGSLINGSATQTLPLSSRNYTQILGLAPGVIADLPTASALGNGTENVASNGATPTSNNLQFNGIDANNLVENSAAGAQSFEVGTAIPAPDAIAEFRIQTANYDAAYGRGTGGNVDLVTKSGTNSFHGSAWEFLRNNIFNANDFFSKTNGQPRAELKQNEFGGSFGGPVLKDKTFFFAAYQGMTQVSGLGDAVTTVIPALTSDRSARTLGAQFCPAGHLDSQGNQATGYITGAGGTQVACDGSNINPVALAVLNAKLPGGQFAVPSPQTLLLNSGANASDQLPQGQSTFALPARYREDQETVDLDHILSASNTTALRFFHSKATTTLPLHTANVPGWSTHSEARNTLFVLSDTHVINTHLVNVGRIGFARYNGISAVDNSLTAQAIGQSTPTGISDASTTAPALTVGGIVLGDGGTPAQWQVTNSFIYQDTVAYSRDRHNLRFGAEIKRHQVDENQPQQADGNVQFGSLPDFLIGKSATQNGSPLGLSNVGLSIAGGGIFRKDERYTDFAVFAQDDWKLLPRLTLNVGLRYEIFSAPTEINGRLPNFDPSLAIQGPLPAAGTYKGFTLPSNFHGAVPAGFAITPYASFYQAPLLDIAPRLGFAWQVMGNRQLVVRGGFGLYFDEHSGNIAEQTISQLPFSTLQFGAGGQNAQATLQSPFAPLLLPPAGYPVFQPLTPDSFPFIEATDPNLRDGRTAEYNLNVQEAFGESYLLEIGYVGTRSTNRPGQIEFDQALLASPQSPVNGETTNSIANAAARLPYQGISEGSLITSSAFIANYNALQVGLTKRMSHGLQLQASYTWSKNLDEVNGEGGTDLFELQLPTNNQLNLRHSSYGLANDDRDQRLAINFIWAPSPLTSTPLLVRAALNHWQFSGIGILQSGAAFSVIDNNAGSVYGLLGGEVRAQLAVGINPSTKGSLFSRVTGSGRYLNGAAFTKAPQAPNATSSADQDFGNSGVGLVRGPGQHSLDMAIERIFAVKGLFKTENSFRLRAEVFNLTNTPQFSNPDNSLGYGNALGPATASGTFGKITGEQGGPHPRILQFAAKYVF